MHIINQTGIRSAECCSQISFLFSLLNKHYIHDCQNIKKKKKKLLHARQTQHLQTQIHSIPDTLQLSRATAWERNCCCNGNSGAQSSVESRSLNRCVGVVFILCRKHPVKNESATLGDDCKLLFSYQMQIHILRQDEPQPLEVIPRQFGSF